MPRILAQCICFCCFLPCNGCGRGGRDLYRRVRTSFRKRVSFCGWRASNSGAGDDEKKVTSSTRETEQLTKSNVKIVVTKSASLSLSSSSGSLKSWRNRSRFWRGRSANNNGGGGGSGGSGRSNTKLCCFCQSVESLQSPEEKYATYKGLRVVTLKKSGTGLGVMIMEGRHAELGQGIFISDIQDGSPAEQAGLFVGDMILAVNSEDMVGSDYEHAANTLKKTEGNVILVVCNASKGKDEEQALLPVVTVKEVRKTSLPGLLQAIVGHDSGKDKDVDGKGGKDIDKPKLPPKPSKIPSPSKLISSVSSAISHRTKISVTSPVATPVTSPQPPTVTIVSPTSSSCSSSSAAVSKLAAHGISPVSPKQLSPSNSHTALAPTTTTPAVSTSPTPSVSTKPATPSPRPSPNPPSASHKMTLHVHGKPVTDPLLDPISCPINPGKETTIEINKDKMGLGLSIVGGSDTLLGSIIIHEVYADGAASKDGRLKPGDQLLSVNHEDFQNISHSKALAALRQTPNKVRMVVYRDESATREDDMYDLIDVELVKKSGKGLGLSIVGRKNGSGVFISDVVPGGIAELHGGLMKGDMIITVDGKDLKNATQEEAASILKTAIGPIRMKIGRLKAAASRRSAASTPVTVPATPTSDNKQMMDENDDPFDTEEEIEPEIIIDTISISTTNGKNNNNKSNGNGTTASTTRSSNNSATSSTSSTTSSNPPSLTGSPPQVKNITLIRGQDGLGFSIVGGYGSPHGNLPIYVKTVFSKGAGLVAGLKRGDQIIAVNSIPCEGLTHHEAVSLLKSVKKGNVRLTILS